MFLFGKLVCVYLSVIIQFIVETHSSPYPDLAWFVHITDIHISVHQDHTRIDQLRDFTQSTLSILQPEVVVCGGDLTESKKSNHLAADQDQREWKLYQQIVTDRWNNTPWLDIRGNHDNLNVLNRNSSHNLFSQYSVQGPLGNLASYNFRYNSKGGQKFNFVAVDATWEVGMNYPFNFVGYIPEYEQEKLNKIVSKFNSDEINIFFGHYPTSVVTQSTYLRELVSQGLVYFSGHLHNLPPFYMQNMYAFHDNGALELELADWKNNRVFRLFAVDHGMFTFSDLKYNEWPVIHPTFPKPDQFIIPDKEPVEKMKDHNEIRVLVFSDVKIRMVRMAVDNEESQIAKTVSDGPLYILPWDPKKFSSGLHTLIVMAEDLNNKTNQVRIQFTLDPSQAKPISNMMPNFVLNYSFATMFQLLFILAFMVNMGVLVGLRLMIYLVNTGKLSGRDLDNFSKLTKCCLIRKLVLICSWDRVWLPLIIFVLYMAIGPWVVGPLVEGHVGAVFAWGILVNDQMAHSQVPFIYYFFHFIFIHPGITLVVGHVLDYRTGNMTRNHTRRRIYHVSCVATLIFGLGISLYLSLIFWLQFGILGFVIGPLKTWSYLFYACLLWLAWSVPPGQCILVDSLRNRENHSKKSDDESGSSLPFIAP